MLPYLYVYAFHLFISNRPKQKQRTLLIKLGFYLVIQKGLFIMWTIVSQFHYISVFTTILHHWIQNLLSHQPVLRHLCKKVLHIMVALLASIWYECVGVSSVLWTVHIHLNLTWHNINFTFALSVHFLYILKLRVIIEHMLCIDFTETQEQLNKLQQWTVCLTLGWYLHMKLCCLKLFCNYF